MWYQLKKSRLGRWEMIVLFAILAVAFSVLFPIFAKAKSYNRGTCTSRLRQLAMAAVMYVQDNHDHRFPGLYPMKKDGAYAPPRMRGERGGWQGGIR